MRTTLSLATLCIAGAFMATSAVAQPTAPQGAVTGERTARAIPADSSVLAARIGMSDVEAIDGGVFTFGGSYDYALDHNLLVGTTLDYWADTFDEGSSRIQMSDVGLGVNGKFVFSAPNVPLRPYALAGLSAHRISVTVSNEERGAEDVAIDRYADADNEAEGRMAADLGGGTYFRVQEALNVTAELRYRRFFDTTLDLDQLAFLGGVAYAM